jgi:hypothetical protein
MKDLALYIAVFVLLLALFSMVALTSSWPDKFAGDQVSHLSGNPNAPIPNSISAACNRTDRLSGNAEQPEFERERASASIVAGISRPSDDPDKPKPQARSAHGRANYLSKDKDEEVDSADPKDDFVYTDDVVE